MIIDYATLMAKLNWKDLVVEIFINLDMTVSVVEITLKLRSCMETECTSYIVVNSKDKIDTVVRSN